VNDVEEAEDFSDVPWAWMRCEIADGVRTRTRRRRDVKENFVGGDSEEGKEDNSEINDGWVIV